MKKQPSQRTRSGEVVMTREELLRRIAAADLTPEEEKVIRMRYGLSITDDTPVGPSEDGPSRVEDLEARVLHRMRATGQVSRKDLIIAQLKSSKG